MISEQQREFIELMIDSEVLLFGSFVTKSGRTSPYFVNTGKYKTGRQVELLGRFYADTIVSSLSGEFDCMFGPAYKGIPLATATACALYARHGIDKPYFFNRKEAKDHGEGGVLVGYQPRDGDRVIIIEDVITAGTNLRANMPLLMAAAKLDVTDMFISVDRCEVGVNGATAVAEVAEEFGITVHPIVTVPDILEYLKDRAEYAEFVPKMQEYMAQYCVL